MAKVYLGPKELDKFIPKFEFPFDQEKYQKQEEEYIEKLREFCKKNGSGKYAGETFQVPCADSYAEYMVFSLRPCEVINMPLGDAWDDPSVSQYSSSYIKDMIDRDKAFKKALEEMKKKS